MLSVNALLHLGEPIQPSRPRSSSHFTSHLSLINGQATEGRDQHLFPTGKDLLTALKPVSMYACMVVWMCVCVYIEKERDYEKLARVIRGAEKSHDCLQAGDPEKLMVKLKNYESESDGQRR